MLRIWVSMVGCYFKLVLEPRWHFRAGFALKPGKPKSKPRVKNLKTKFEGLGFIV